jgi:dienelactone hydrolase
MIRTKIATGVALLCGLAGALPVNADGPTRVLGANETPADSRLGEGRTLRSYHPWTPYASRSSWEARKTELRTQMRVATGLWPMPPKTPAKATIHGKIDRGDYTVEKVFFASFPGHYVTGNLYRPKDRTDPGPAVLSPHGHWADGRLVDLGEEKGKKEIESGAAKTMPAARYPLQARCAQLARMGCVVFHYDMVGYADSKQVGHTHGFRDVEAELRMQNFLGLQTYNAVRAFDFLAGLEDVDPKRIAVTGASGGGTQTFMLCGIDDRPAACFPAVMVSTGMQGGCICENASLLRVATGNIEIAALASPRPLGLTGADDWTREIETKGGPELRRHYKMLGIEDRLTIAAFTQFGHNYNQVSREVMYNFMNEHLNLGHPIPIVEQPFEPIAPEDLHVFDDEHKLPIDAIEVDQLRDYMTYISDAQLAKLRPHDAASLAAFKALVGPALAAVTATSLPEPGDVESVRVDEVAGDGFTMWKETLSRRDSGEQVPIVVLVPEDFKGTAIVSVLPEGKRMLFGDDGEPVAPARRLLTEGVAIVAPDVFLTGEYNDGETAPTYAKIDAGYAGYTFGYNRTILGNRVHDILTTIAYVQQYPQTDTIHLAGMRSSGPIVILAKALAGDAVTRTLADLDGFDFDQVYSVTDPMFLPGALKYGGMGAFLALCVPDEVMLVGESSAVPALAAAAARAAGKPDAIRLATDSEQILRWLLR